MIPLLLATSGWQVPSTSRGRGRHDRSGRTRGGRGGHVAQGKGRAAWSTCDSGLGPSSVIQPMSPVTRHGQPSFSRLLRDESLPLA